MNKPLPSLISMRAFESTARHMSFTHAAQELCVTQAAISHQIKALEEYVGKPLFRRINRTVKLTKTGKYYAAQLHDAFDILHKATAEVTLRAVDNVLSISTFDSIASAFLMPRLDNLHKTYPKLAIHVITSDRFCDFVRDDIDLEIRYGDGNWPQYHVTKLADEQIVPICSPTFLPKGTKIKTAADLLQFRIIHDIMKTDWQDWFSANGIEDANIENGYTINHSHLVVQAAINGEGIALGRSLLIQDALASHALIKPFNVPIESEYAYYLVCPKTIADDEWVTIFRTWLEQEMAQ